jgi:hypothetical protein
MGSTVEEEILPSSLGLGVGIEHDGSVQIPFLPVGVTIRYGTQQGSGAFVR